MSLIMASRWRAHLNFKLNHRLCIELRAVKPVLLDGHGMLLVFARVHVPHGSAPNLSPGRPTSRCCEQPLANLSRQNCGIECTRGARQRNSQGVMRCRNFAKACSDGNGRPRAP